MVERREMCGQKKTFPDAWKVSYYELLQHLLPPSLLSLTGPFLKVFIVNHKHRNFVNPRVRRFSVKILGCPNEISSSGVPGRTT